MKIGCTILFLVCGFCAAQSKPEEAAHQVPVVNGGAGPCSLELTITAAGKAVYAAAVKVHIAYGFGGFHKLDLEASSNIDGKVKFTGLPARVRRPPLEFRATKEHLAGTVTFDPEAECKAERQVSLEKPQ